MHSIGFDSTLNNEEEEDKYERAEFDQDNYTNNSCHLQAVYPNLNPVLKRTDTKEDNPGPKKRARFDPEFKEENDPISHHAVPQLLGKVNRAAEGPDYTSLIEHSDVVTNITRFLSVWDVLSLGCCSKYLNALCESDSIWKELFERRCQAASEITKSSKEVASTSCSNYKEWKAEYVSNHRRMANMIPMALKPLKYTIGANMLDGCNYFQAVDHLKRLKLKFEDVYFFLFKKELSVTINMVGMHYAFFCLGSPVKDLKMALMRSGVAEKKVCLRWSLKSLETMPKECYSEVYSLGEIADMGLAVLYLFVHHRTHANETQISSLKIVPCGSSRRGELMESA